MSAATKGAISGAAQGAAYGSVIPGWGTAVGAVVGGVAGLIAGGSADAQQENQEAWAEYENRMKLLVGMNNIDSSLKIADMNAAMTMAAAGISSTAIEQAAEYNAAMTFGTVTYNNLLQEQDLARVWQDMDLSLEQLAAYRSRERGAIVADQAASGTVLGEGSNADVVISQRTQEAMDANIIMFGADRQAANIMNSMSQNTWQGKVAIQQTLWEGQTQSYVTKANAAIQAGGTLVSSRIKANADRWSLQQGFDMGGYAIEMNANQFNEQQTQNMIGGLFKAAGTYTTTKIASKAPGSGSPTTSTGGGTSGTGGYRAPPPLLTAPGSSMMVNT